MIKVKMKILSLLSCYFLLHDLIEELDLFLLQLYHLGVLVCLWFCSVFLEIGQVIFQNK